MEVIVGPQRTASDSGTLSGAGPGVSGREEGRKKGKKGKWDGTTKQGERRFLVRENQK